MSIESQRAAAALWESGKHYRAVAEAATDAIIIDSNSTILTVNPTTQRIFGYSTEEMIAEFNLLADEVVANQSVRALDYLTLDNATDELSDELAGFAWQQTGLVPEPRDRTWTTDTCANSAI